MRDIEASEELIVLTARIVAAHISGNAIAAADIPGLIRKVHQAMADLGKARAPQPAPRQTPAVPIRASVTADHIVCLEDGKKLKTLKRYLLLRYGMTPEEYRAKWRLPADYPMVAPVYTEQRRALAKKIGLGTMRRR